MRFTTRMWPIQLDIDMVSGFKLRIEVHKDLHTMQIVPLQYSYNSAFINWLLRARAELTMIALTIDTLWSACWPPVSHSICQSLAALAFLFPFSVRCPPVLCWWSYNACYVVVRRRFRSPVWGVSLVCSGEHNLAMSSVVCCLNVISAHIVCLLFNSEPFRMIIAVLT